MELPEEILEKIFEFVSLHDLCMTVQVCRRWRQVAETPKLWSEVIVRVNETNQFVVSEILRSRRMQAVSRIDIYYGVSLSVDGWEAVIQHPGLKQLVVMCSLEGLENGLVARIITSKEYVSVGSTSLTVDQLTAVCNSICLGSPPTVKTLSLYENPNVGRIEPGLLGKLVCRLENIFIGRTDLSKEQVTAILSEISDTSALTLKVLDLAWNYNVRGVDPELFGKAVTRLEELFVSDTDLTVEQKVALREAQAEILQCDSVQIRFRF